MALSMIAVSASTVKSAKVLYHFDQPFINHFYTISLQDGADFNISLSGVFFLQQGDHLHNLHLSKRNTMGMRSS